MFSRLIYARMKRAALKVIESDDGTQRVAEIQFVHEPLKVETANDLGSAIARHLFTDTGAMRQEVRDVSFEPQVGLQVVTVRGAVDVEPEITLTEVALIELRATQQYDAKSGKGWYRLVFTLSVDLAERGRLHFIVERLGAGLHLSFTPQQSTIQDALRNAVDHFTANGSSSITLINPDGTRGESVTVTDEQVAAARRRLASKVH